MPHFTVYTDLEHPLLEGKKGSSVQWLSPAVLQKEFYNLIKKEGETGFFAKKFADSSRALFWNLIYYFKMMRLPYFFVVPYLRKDYVASVVAGLDAFLPAEKPRSNAPKSKLNLENLQELPLMGTKELLVPLANRTPSLYDGVGGGGHKEVDLFSQEDSTSVGGPKRGEGGRSAQSVGVKK